MIKIVLDTFGADLGEEELIKGALNSSKNHNIKLILVGNQTLNEKAVKKYNLCHCTLHGCAHPSQRYSYGMP